MSFWYVISTLPGARHMVRQNKTLSCSNREPIANEDCNRPLDVQPHTLCRTTDQSSRALFQISDDALARVPDFTSASSARRFERVTNCIQAKVSSQSLNGSHRIEIDLSSAAGKLLILRSPMREKDSCLGCPSSCSRHGQLDRELVRQDVRAEAAKVVRALAHRDRYHVSD